MTRQTTDQDTVQMAGQMAQESTDPRTVQEAFQVAQEMTFPRTEEVTFQATGKSTRGTTPMYLFSVGFFTSKCVTYGIFSLTGSLSAC